MSIAWAGRLGAVGASGTEVAAIQASYDSSVPNVQQALDALIEGIDNASLAVMLTNWRASGGPFTTGLPGGGLPFGTHVPLLTGLSADDAFYIGAGTGAKGTPGSGGSGGSATTQGSAGTNLGATQTIDYASTKQQIDLVGTLNANLTVTLSNRAANCVSVLMLTQDATGGRTLTISDGTTTQTVGISSAANTLTMVLVKCPDGTNIDVSVVGGSSPVLSVLGRTGAVTAQTGDYTAAQVTNAADRSSASQQAFTGEVKAPDFNVTGLTGATAGGRYVGVTASGAPGSGTFLTGDWVTDQTGKRFTCTAGGSPGTWAQEPGTGGGGASVYTFWQPSDGGLLAANYPVFLATKTQETITTNFIHFLRVDVPQQITIAKVAWYLQSAGSTLTTGQNLIGVYNSSGNLIGLSGDLTASDFVGAAGWRQTTLTVQSLQSLTVGPSDYVVVAILANGTTGPQIASFGNSLANLLAGGPGGFTKSSFAWKSAANGQTSLPASWSGISAGTASHDVFVGLV